MQNGCPGANAKVNPGGGIFLRGGSLTATNTDFIGNTPGTNTKLPKGDGDLNGGAIYSGSTKADITITGGKFENNEVKAYGHGAAIYQENGTLNVTGTSFKNNKGHVEGGNAGTQGACIHTRDKVKATISNVEAEIAKGFNTGGFLRSWGSDVTVTNSTFTIKDLGDGYGYSGGALCFENGTSKVTGSTFTCTGSKLYHAGGFIDIVGGGEHKIDNNTMTGAGKENGQQIASFGGAISVEESANATVTITNNTIKNTSASDTGGAIAIGTHKGKSTPSTVTMSGNTISNAGTLFWGGQYGGGVFVAPDATVTMTKDTMSDTRSSYGGGIYNEGNLTITGGSSLTGGVGSKLGGEIYNNGELTVDDATIIGSFVGPNNWSGNPHPNKPYEYGGVNIYAEKSVTITPKANITTGKDVRVLDGQSKILLTGPLTKEIDVSISEIDGGSETQKRRVGYVIAEGSGYTATKSDAKFLHYIGRTNKKDANHYSNQPRAAYDDDKSPGMWDFVLDKDNKKVVLGQRVKLIYHGNLGKIGAADKEEKTVDVYKNPKFWEGQLADYKVADPKLEGSSFMGWYFWKDGESAGDTDDSIQNIKIPDDLREKLFDFSRVEFKNNVEKTDKIITPNIIHTYAGWSQNISIPVLKEWVDAKDTDKVEVTVTLKGGDEEKTLTLTKAGNYFNQFEDLKVFTKSYEGEEKNKNLRFTPITYSVEETKIDGFTPSYSPQSMIANQVAEVSRFVVTNKKTFKVTYEFVPEDTSKTLPEAVTKLKPANQTGVANGTTITPETFKDVTDGEDTWTFKGWAPTEQTINKADIHFVGTWALAAKPQPKTGSVYVKYVDEQGKEISEKTELKKDAPVGEEYTATPKTIESYENGEWQEGSAPAKGTVAEGEQTVVYVYKKVEETPKTGSVYVKYVDEQGKEISEKTELKKDAPVGEDYSASPKTIEGYETGVWQKGSAPEKGKVAEGEQTVVYVYKKVEETPKTGSVYVKYVDEKGAEISDKTELKKDAPVGEDYTATPKTIEGYETGVWQKGSAPVTGKVKEGEQTVIYVYKKIEEKPKTGSVYVKYVDEKGAEISEKTELKKDAPIGEDYSATPKTIEGYEYLKLGDNSAPEKGKVEEGEKTVVYVYKVKNKPNPPTTITTDYVDEQGTKLIPSKDGAHPKEDIPGYEYLKTEKTKDKVTHIYKKIEKPEPQPPIIPEKPEFNPFWPIYFGSEEKHVVSEKTALNKEDHKAYMFGYPNWNFLPNSNMTRAEVTAMFARLLKNYPSTDVKYNLPYSDVFESDWYYPAVGFMTENNIIKGYEDGTFRPNAPITRAEFATIASKFEELVGNGVNGFKDVPATHWALKYINSAYARGWVTGYEDGTFRPDRYITRAEVVTVTNKMLIRYADVDFVRANKDILLHFKDLDESHWAYFNIMEATHGHDFTRKANMLDEIWHRLNGEAFIFPDLKYNDR